MNQKPTRPGLLHPRIPHPIALNPEPERPKLQGPPKLNTTSTAQHKHAITARTPPQLLLPGQLRVHTRQK